MTVLQYHLEPNNVFLLVIKVTSVEIHNLLIPSRTYLEMSLAEAKGSENRIVGHSYW